MKHKHCDLIKAWADGAEIQQKHPVDPTKWEEISKYPSWSDGMEYRIKPKTTKYRLYLNDFGWGSVVCLLTENCSNPCSWLEKSEGFVRWLSDWQEVEV
jgi:hypothetical protein